MLSNWNSCSVTGVNKFFDSSALPLPQTFKAQALMESCCAAVANKRLLSLTY